MNKTTYSGRFRSALFPWLGWGVVCGSVSFLMAVLIGFSSSRPLLEMCAGIVTWGGVCAWICATDGYSKSALTGPGWSPLRVALVVRSISTVIFCLMIGLGRSNQADFLLFFVPDMWTGALSIEITGLSGGAKDHALQPIGIVYVTTLIQGAFVVFSILLLAIAVHLVRQLRGRKMRQALVKE